MTAELEAALAAEHAAIFAYGPIGSHLTGAVANEARAAEAAHRNRRDALVLQLTGDGATPPPAAPAYDLPEPVIGRASALRVAAGVEERTAAVWRAALAATEGDRRRSALAGFSDAAVRATRWRRYARITPLTVAFPGKTA